MAASFVVATCRWDSKPQLSKLWPQTGGGGGGGYWMRCEVTDHLDTATQISKTLPVASEGHPNEAARYFIGLLQSNRQKSITPCGTMSQLRCSIATPTNAFCKYHTVMCTHTVALQLPYLG